MMSVHINHLNLEHHRPNEAFGIGASRPRISWKYGGDIANWLQTSYEIRVIRTGSNEEQFHKVSSESVLVPWPSRPLESGESAVVYVRGSNSEHTTEWSDPVTVEAGLLNRDGWHDSSLIISTLSTDTEKPKVPVRFRTDFSVPTASSFKKARLYATAHGVYEAVINGQRVGNQVLAPGWQSYSHRLAYQTYDVTDMILGGKNTLGAEVAEGWYIGRLGYAGGARNLYGDHIGLIMKLIVTMEDGSIITTGTHGGWKSAPGQITSAEIYDGETWDMRQYIKGWSSPNFDESGWVGVVACDIPEAELVAPAGPPVRATQQLGIQYSFLSSSGKRILDFGQNLVGRLRIRIPIDLPIGAVIEITHAEVLEEGEIAIRPLRHAKCTDRLIIGDQSYCGIEYWEPKFTFHGFRYAQIKGWPSSEFASGDVTAIVLHTDMERTGYFECSDPMINKLHDNIVWSMRGNFFSIPTDCPQRDERLGWTGDIAVFVPTANYLYDTCGMLSDWLKDLSADQLVHPDGVPPLVVPDILQQFGPRTGSALWGDCVTLVPWNLFQTFGDETILENQYASIQAWLGKAVIRDHDGLWQHGGGGFRQLGDWLDPKAPPDEPGNSVTDPYLVADAFLIRSFELAGNIAARLDRLEDAANYSEQAAKLKVAFQHKYITPSGRIVSDSQTAYALAICFSLFATPSQTAVAASRLKTLILENARFKIATGFAGTPFLPHALTKINATQLFYRMLMHKKCPSWLYQVKMGATTVWERWDSMLADGSVNKGEMTSFNHYALGAVANWMHAVVGGISPLEPGWKKIRIAPIPGADLKWAKAKYSGPYGMVQSEWKLQGQSLVIEVMVPANSTAEVLLPGSGETKVVGPGQHSFKLNYKAEEWPPIPKYPPHYPHDDDEP